MRDPDAIMLEKLEEAFAEMLCELEEDGFEDASYLWALVPQTEAIILSEQDPADFDDHTEKPFWVLKMEREMEERMSALKSTMRRLSHMSKEELADFCEQARGEAEMAAERYAEMRAGC